MNEMSLNFESAGICQCVSACAAISDRLEIWRVAASEPQNFLFIQNLNPLSFWHRPLGLTCSPMHGGGGGGVDPCVVVEAPGSLTHAWVNTWVDTCIYIQILQTHIFKNEMYKMYGKGGLIPT